MFQVHIHILQIQYIIHSSWTSSWWCITRLEVEYHGWHWNIRSWINSCHIKAHEIQPLQWTTYDWVCDQALHCLQNHNTNTKVHHLRTCSDSHPDQTFSSKRIKEAWKSLKKLKRSLKKIKEDWSPDQLTSQSAAALDLQELELSEAARLES